jgi:hypothetical protein
MLKFFLLVLAVEILVTTANAVYWQGKWAMG